MTILEFLNIMTNLFGQALKYLIVVVAVVWMYGYFAQEEYDEDYVTFTVSCHSVLHDAEHYPAYIVNYCTENRN